MIVLWLIDFVYPYHCHTTVCHTWKCRVGLTSISITFIPIVLQISHLVKTHKVGYMQTAWWCQEHILSFWGKESRLRPVTNSLIFRMNSTVHRTLKPAGCLLLVSGRFTFKSWPRKTCCYRDGEHFTLPGARFTLRSVANYSRYSSTA